MAAPRVLDWYRVDPWPRMRRLLLGGPALLTFGGLLVAVSLLTHQRHRVVTDVAFFGFALVAGGALLTAAGMHRILRDDAYVAIRTDGLLVRLGGAEEQVAWEALATARWDAQARQIVLERQGAEAIAVPHRFARVTGPELARRIEQARARASLGMLR